MRQREGERLRTKQPELEILGAKQQEGEGPGTKVKLQTSAFFSSSRVSLQHTRGPGHRFVPSLSRSPSFRLFLVFPQPGRIIM